MTPDLKKEFGNRLVKLASGQMGLRGTLAVKVTTPTDTADKPIIDVIASDETLDRYDETITAAGWKLDNYRRNPVFLNSHNYCDIAHCLGKALAVEIRDGKLFMRVEFAVDINPVAKIAYGLYKGGFLNAVSVGFMPIRWENGGDQAEYYRKYLEQELLENSGVVVPANPNALQFALDEGSIEKSDLSEMEKFIKQFCSNTGDSKTNAGASGSGVDQAPLLQLARDAKQLLAR